MKSIFIFISLIFISFVFMSFNIFKIDYTYKSVSRQLNKFDEMPKHVLDNIDSLGVKESATLNKYEVKYLESLFGDSLADFNFKGKKIGFIASFISSRYKSSNTSYFYQIKERFNSGKRTGLACSLLILTEEQKKLSKGYDAVILYWSKFQISDKKLIEALLQYTYKHVPRQKDEFDEMPKQVLDNIDSLGVEKSTTLNKYEVKYLESLFGDNLADFNFKGKKIGFIGGLLGKTSSKSYFDDIKDGFYNVGTSTGSASLASSLLILTEEQKKLSGGYDAVILYWYKMIMTDKQLIEVLLGEINDPVYKKRFPQIDEFDEMPKQVLDNINSLGVKESATLNKYEVKYFESLFGNNLADFDLKGKKIGFIASRRKSSNKLYFDKIKANFYDIRTSTAAVPARLACNLLILTEEYKKLAGGYDAVILYSNWRESTISDKKLIKILSREVHDPVSKD